VPKSGIIQSIRFYDLDDEGLNMELALFREDFTAQADNAAFVVADNELVKLAVGILIDTWRDYGNNQVGVEDNLGIAYRAPLSRLWGQWITRGGPTIAAGSSPSWAMTILADE